MKRWNHCVCDKCGGVTIARHDDDGVTPMFMRCRVKDFLSLGGSFLKEGCVGTAQSLGFRCNQSDRQVPHVIFYRPGKAIADELISREPDGYRQWLAEHYEKGGALMRDNLDAYEQKETSSPGPAQGT